MGWQGLGELSQRLVDALVEGEKDLGELARSVYGINELSTRENAQQLIANLRHTRGYVIKKRTVYRLVARGGDK